jgi:hypothetical protein
MKLTNGIGRPDCGCPQGDLCPHAMAFHLSEVLHKENFSQLLKILHNTGLNSMFMTALRKNNKRINPKEDLAEVISRVEVWDEEMPLLDITPEQLEEDRLKQDPDEKYMADNFWPFKIDN